MDSLSRRTLLLGGATAVAATALGACSPAPRTTTGFDLPRATPLTPAPGQRVVTRTLLPAPVTVDLGGPVVSTWAYDGVVPGPLLRATAGDLVRVRVRNQLPSDTSVHWHGVAVRNAADGVPGLTQEPIAPGTSYDYEFVAPDPGTYFHHPHVGVQLDRGLQAPLVVDDPREPGEYDDEWVVVLDDWIDGTGTTPDEVLAELMTGDAPGSGHGHGMATGGGSSPYGNVGDVRHPWFLVNGRVAAAPETHHARPGQRIRLRVINAAADTVFAVALGGHRLTLTHTDGFAVEPYETSAFYIGMGERYDAVVTVGDGVFPLVAKPVDKKGHARALLRSGAGAAPRLDADLPELAGVATTVMELRPAASSRLSDREPTEQVALTLTGGMSGMSGMGGMGDGGWGINGAAFPDNSPIALREGARTRVAVTNATMMTHPVHIHGHTFALPNGLRKDTVLVAPMQRLDLALQADNPGNWAAHCHNIYHAEAGMMAAMVYA